MCPVDFHGFSFFVLTVVVNGPHDSAAEVEANVQAAFEYYASSNIDLHQNVIDVKTVRVSQGSGKAKDEGKKLFGSCHSNSRQLWLGWHLHLYV